MKLLDRLALLEEALETDTAGVTSSALEAKREIERCQHELNQAKANLQRAVAKINGGLAMAIRSSKPGLNISLERDSVTVGYYARSLKFTPNLDAGVWRVDSSLPKLAVNFQRKNVPLQLTDDFSGLATAITTYFNHYYRSLNETIEGTGKLLLERKLVNVSDLAAYMRG